jgi:tetratricopeptide (TPR) repeat protein
VELIDLEDVAGSITQLETALADRGLDRIARAALGALYVETGQAQKAFDMLEPITLDDDAPASVLYNAWRAAALLGQGGARMMWLQRATQLEPVSPAGRLMGLMMGEQGAYTEALRLLRPWARTFPDDNEVRVAAAAAALQLERAPDAEELLADLPQDDPRVRLLWGKLLVLQGDPFGALATLKALPGDLDPELDLGRRRTMAQAHTIAGQAAEAIALLEGRVDDNPGVALQLSHALFQSGRVSQAAAVMEPFAKTVLSKDESLGGTLEANLTLEYGQLLNSLGRQLDALPYLERSAKLDPDNKLVWQNLGQSLNAAGRREEAKAALERFRQMTESEVPAVAKVAALRADAGDPTGRNLREALKKLGGGQTVEALKMARSEARLAPHDIRPKLVEAQILVSMELLDEALTVALGAIEISPDSADARYQKAVVHMARQELEQAEADFRIALGLAADHVATLNDLAVLLMVQDRQDEARPFLERALEINPRDRVAADNLEQISSTS